MGSSQNFSVEVGMFGAEIDDSAIMQSDRKAVNPSSFMVLGKSRPESSRKEPTSSVMEDELKSLQSKIMDLENKLCFAHEDLAHEDTTQDHKDICNVKINQTGVSTKRTDTSKSRAESSDGEKSIGIKKILQRTKLSSRASSNLSERFKNQMSSDKDKAEKKKVKVEVEVPGFNKVHFADEDDFVIPQPEPHAMADSGKKSKRTLNSHRSEQQHVT